MKDVRIVGVIWIVSAVVPAVQLAIELYSLATHPTHEPETDTQGTEFWISQLLVEVAFLLITIIGCGLLFLRRWAVVAGAILGVISLMVCAWFIVTQGRQHGLAPYVAIWCGVALSVLTIISVWRLRRQLNKGVSPAH